MAKFANIWYIPTVKIKQRFIHNHPVNFAGTWSKCSPKVLQAGVWDKPETLLEEPT